MPHKNRDQHKCQAVRPNIIKSQATVIGMPPSKIGFLYPTKIANVPKNNVPVKAPNDTNEPTHPIMSTAIGPPKGLSADMSSGWAGANHPTLVPIANDTMLTIRYTKKKQFKTNKKNKNLSFTNDRSQDLKFSSLKFMRSHCFIFLCNF